MVFASHSLNTITPVGIAQPTAAHLALREISVSTWVVTLQFVTMGVRKPVIVVTATTALIWKQAKLDACRLARCLGVKKDMSVTNIPVIASMVMLDRLEQLA